MHIAFHGCQQDLGGRFGVLGFCFFLLDKRDEVCDGFFHHTGAFDNLWEKHLAFGEQVADYVHPFHQRSLDDIQRARVFLPRLFRIFVNVIDNSLYERMLQSFFYGSAPPFRLFCLCFRLVTLNGFRKFHKAFGCVWTSVEEHILDPFQQCAVNVIVHGKLTGIDNTHVEPGMDGMEQKCSMHRFPYRIVAAERERHVTDTTRYFGMGKVLLDPAD